jgi:hypothetical protein
MLRKRKRRKKKRRKKQGGRKRQTKTKSCVSSAAVWSARPLSPAATTHVSASATTVPVTHALSTHNTSPTAHADVSHLQSWRRKRRSWRLKPNSAKRRAPKSQLPTP